MPEWIPWSLNQKADWLSHIEDYNNWAIHPDHFRMLDDSWGPHTIDRFACSYKLALIPTSGIQERKQWMPSHVTGQVRLTGCALLPT